GFASIYIFRERGAGAGAADTKTLLDGRLAGPVDPHTFIALTVKPGSHTITASGSAIESVIIEAQAGHNYFVRQTPYFGWVQTGATLKRVSESEGVDAVRNCKLVSHVPGI